MASSQKEYVMAQRHRDEESGTVGEPVCSGLLPNEHRQVLGDCNHTRDGVIISDEQYALLRECARESDLRLWACDRGADPCSR